MLEAVVELEATMGEGGARGCSRRSPPRAGMPPRQAPAVGEGRRPRGGGRKALRRGTPPGRRHGGGGEARRRPATPPRADPAGGAEQSPAQGGGWERGGSRHRSAGVVREEGAAAARLVSSSPRPRLGRAREERPSVAFAFASVCWRRRFLPVNVSTVHARQTEFAPPKCTSAVGVSFTSY